MAHRHGLRQDLPHDCLDIEYNDDSVVQMSQPADDSAPRDVSSRRFESLGGEWLHIAHFVDREADDFREVLGEDDGSFGRGAPTRQSCREIDHRNDRPAKVDQPPNELRRTGKPRSLPDRHDLAHGSDIAAVHRVPDGEQQQPEWRALGRSVTQWIV